MSATNKTFSGILAFLPIIAFIVYLFVFLKFVFENALWEHNFETEPAFLMPSVMGIVISAILLALLTLGVLVYFIVHAINNKAIDSTEKLIWVLIFLFAGMPGFPIYWYMRVYRQKNISNDSGQQQAV